MKLNEYLEITNEDNMEMMKRYPDNHFDIAIVDPPYGIGDFRQSKSRNIHKSISWNNKIPSSEYFNELTRVSKNRIIWGINYYSKHVDDVGRIVHDKTSYYKRKNPKELSDCDIASHSFGVNMKIFHYVSIGNVVGDKIDWENKMRWHPCQKPVALYEWLFKNYAKKGDRILDTHLGSGSIAIALHNMNERDGMDLTLTACELDKDYYDASIKRIRQHTAQKTIFSI